MLESLTTAPQADFAATDMMHRRIPLLHRFQLMLGDSIVAIKTDSPLMNEALGSCVGSIGSSCNADSAVWDIAVEVRNEAAPLQGCDEMDGFETCCFGSGRSLRLESGSWFAHTPPSLSGVGFAMISGDESCQIQQLEAFLDRIVLFLGDGESRPNSFMKHGVHG